jgi:arylsulfatase A-like enzyme
MLADPISGSTLEMRPAAAVGAAARDGAFLFAALGLLEWVVLELKAPVHSGWLLIRDLGWNVFVYSAVGALLGVVVGTILVAFSHLSSRRASGAGVPGLHRHHVCWSALLACTLGFYWVFAANRLCPRDFRDPVALALSGVALLLAVMMFFVLLKIGRGGVGHLRRVRLTVSLLLILWLPFYIVSAEPAVGRTRGTRIPEENAEVMDAGGCPNIILIMTDTTRSDCLGCYGSEECPTPNFDRLAREGVLFEQCISVEPLTRPMTCTLFTGLYPRTHGVDTHTKSLDDDFLTLAEVLRSRGYETAAFTAASVLSGFFGTDQGFDLYMEPTEPWWYLRSDFAVRRLYILLTSWGNWEMEIRADETTRRATRWIGKERERPFFAFVHYFDPHAPYDPPRRHDLAASDGLEDLPVPYEYEAQRFEDGFDMPDDYLLLQWRRYHSEIAFVDEEVGKLMAFLDEERLAEETVVLLVGDHGEGFEHGFYFAHAYRLYDALVHVPFIIRYPGGVAGQRVAAQVRLIDIFPTLLSLAGVEPGPEIQGEGLLSLMEPATESATGLGAGSRDRPAYCQTDCGDSRPFYAGMSFGVRMPPWKYIESPEIGLIELYNLDADPLETENLAERRQDLVVGFAADLQTWMEETEYREVEPEALSPEFLEALRALGYLQ